eukprot:scaffold2277_cov256-Pinguiococcus_pyrenoidosus.AAC.23
MSMVSTSSGCFSLMIESASSHDSSALAASPWASQTRAIWDRISATGLLFEPWSAHARSLAMS